MAADEDSTALAQLRGGAEVVDLEDYTEKFALEDYDSGSASGGKSSPSSVIKQEGGEQPPAFDTIDVGSSSLLSASETPAQTDEISLASGTNMRIASGHGMAFDQDSLQEEHEQSAQENANAAGSPNHFAPDCLPNATNLDGSDANRSLDTSPTGIVTSDAAPETSLNDEDTRMIGLSGQAASENAGHLEHPNTNMITNIPPAAIVPRSAPSETSNSGTTTLSAGLGSSILQPRNLNIVNNVSSAEARKNLLDQQRAMAEVYKASISRPSQPTNSGDDQFAVEGQKPTSADTSNDSELAYQQMKREWARQRLNGTLTPAKEIEFMKRERQYERQKKKERGELSSEDEDEDLFVKEKPSKRRKISKSVGAGRGKSKVKATPGSSETDDEEVPAKKGRGRPAGKKSTKPKATKKRSKKPIERRLNSNHSFGLSNIIADAQAAEAIGESQPTFDINEVGKRKNAALRALVDNVPTESKRIAQTDRVILDKAIKDFTGLGTVKPHEGGKWLVNGMQTSLTPHQVIGTAFMRRREGAKEAPKGGILADQMGLGKTLMALANIVNGRNNPLIQSGRPASEDQLHTTLIVVPSSILPQWQDEIKKHCVKKPRNRGWGIGSVFIYRESNCGNIDEDDLWAHDIVLTTYGEVSKSWPVMDSPDLPEGEERDTWLNNNFYEKRGVLHKTRFLRVCLDEAHQIRNPDTRTSQACRGLVAEHHWAITGSPCVNSSIDLYALYDFIKHPIVRGKANFKKRFVDAKNPMSTDLLSEELNNCMIRHTHRNQLFGARLVTLPKARSNVLTLGFTRLEHSIYEIVRTRFKVRVQKISDDGKLRTKLPHIFVLMLRLRQLTSHPLMIQGEICSCLEREDFEKLDRLCDKESSHRGDGANMIVSIRNILAKERRAADMRIAAEHQDGADEQYKTEVPTNYDRQPVQGDVTGKSKTAAGGSHGRNQRFSKYLTLIKGSDTYTKMNERVRCSTCMQPPYQPFLTDCNHVYCKVCLEDLLADAAELGQNKASCSSCGQEMTARPMDFPDPATARDSSHDSSSTNGKKRKKPSGEDMPGWLDLDGEILPSTKTLAVKSAILNWWDESTGGDPEAKIILFTQWLQMIKVLQKMCTSENWGCSTLTGKMDTKRRQNELNEFKHNPEKRILISSLKCGGIGLNLTCASKVIVLEPWWNFATEDQAFSRVFRIGQDKETSMLSLVIRDSIDEKLNELKEKKKIEIDKVMLDHKERAKVNLKDILGVLGEVDEDESGKLFFTDGVGANRAANGGEAGEEEEGEGEEVEEMDVC